MVDLKQPAHFPHMCLCLVFYTHTYMHLHVCFLSLSSKCKLFGTVANSVMPESKSG